PGWTMLPSAAAFVDPLLSTGFPLTLLGIERLAAAVEESWGTPGLDERLATDGLRALEEADAAARLVAALYATFSDFPTFAELTKLSFAAASCAEAARRLGRPELSGGFLSHDHPSFGPAFRETCGLASRAPDEVARRVADAIAPLDVIGLSDRSRRNWYPVLAQDLIDGAPKLGATQAEIEDLLRRTLGPAPTREPTEAAARSR